MVVLRNVGLYLRAGRRAEGLSVFQGKRPLVSVAFTLALFAESCRVSRGGP